MDHPEGAAKWVVLGSILIVGYGWKSMARRYVQMATTVVPRAGRGAWPK
jgi:hypothetical protein